MCSDEKLSGVAEESPLRTDRESVFGAPNFCALLSTLRSTAATAGGKRADRTEYNRKFFASTRGKAVIRSYEQRNRPKRNAYNQLRRAMERGVLTRPSQCETCGVECRPEGHHDDYAKPLDVRWLCRYCHKRWHSEHGEAANG